MTHTSKNIANLDKDLYGYMLDHSVRESEHARALREETSNHVMRGMISSPETAQLLRFLVTLISARKVLEIGVYTGYSTLAIASSLPDDGLILACETRKEWTEIGKKYWEKAGVAHKIELEIGPAVETLEGKIRNGEKETYDFAFIDADKENYPLYYELSLSLIKPRGLICIDNVLWNGKILNSDDTSVNTTAIRNLNTTIFNDTRVESSILPMADGITLVAKK
jgi:predicted O-methyltransferase YrrM